MEKNRILCVQGAVVLYTISMPSTSVFSCQHAFTNAPYTFSSSKPLLTEGQAREICELSNKSDGLSEIGEYQGSKVLALLLSASKG